MADQPLHWDEVREMERRWNSRPRSAAWASRYGVDLSQVEKYIGDRIQARQDQIDKDAAVERERIVTNRRIATITRVSAVAVLLALIFSGYMGVRAKTTNDAANARLALANARVLQAEQQAKTTEQRANAKAAQANRNSAMMSSKAQREQLAANAAIARAQVLSTDAQNAHAQAQTALSQARTAGTRAETYTAQTYLAAGRQAFFNGDIDDAAVALAAAYKHDPNNPAVQMLLPQALDNLDIRAPLVHASNATLTALQFDPEHPGLLATADADGNVALRDASGETVKDFGSIKDIVSALAFDRSGTHLAVGGASGTLVIYEVRSGKAARVRTGGGRVRQVAFNPGGSIVATGGDDGILRLWSANGKALRTIAVTNAHDEVRDTAAQNAGGSASGAIDDLAFSPNGATIVTGSGTGALQAWHTATGSPAWAQFSNRARSVQHIAMLRGGAVVATFSDGSVWFHANSPAEAVDARFGNVLYNDVAVNPAGTKAALAADDGTVRIADTQTQQQIAALSSGHDAGTPVPVMSVRFSADGRFIAAGYWNGRIALWSADGARIASFQAHSGQVSALRFADSGTGFASVAADGTLNLAHVPDSLVAAGAHRDRVDRIIAVPGSDRFVTASRDGTAALWSLQPQLHRIATLPHTPGQYWVSDVEVSSDGSRILTLGGTKALVWDENGKLVHRLTAATGLRLSSGAFLPGGGYVVAQRALFHASPSYTSSRWFAFKPNNVSWLQQAGWQRDIQSVSADDSGHVLAISPNTDYVSLGRLGSRHEQLLTGMSAATLVPGRSFYLTGTQDGEVQSRSLNADRILYHTSSGTSRITTLAVSPDASLVAWSSSGSQAVQIRRMTAGGTFSDPGTAIALQSAGAEIETIAFSPAGARYVLATCADGIARVWDRSSGDLVETIVAPDDVTAAVFAGDAQQIVVATARGTVYLRRPRHLLDGRTDVSASVRPRVSAGGLSANAAFKAAWRDLAGGSH